MDSDEFEGPRTKTTIEHEVYIVKRVKTPSGQGYVYMMSDEHAKGKHWTQIDPRGIDFPDFLTALVDGISGAEHPHTYELKYDESSPLGTTERRALDSVIVMHNRDVRIRYRLREILNDI